MLSRTRALTLGIVGLLLGGLGGCTPSDDEPRAQHLRTAFPGRGPRLFAGDAWRTNADDFVALGGSNLHLRAPHDGDAPLHMQHAGGLALRIHEQGCRGPRRVQGGAVTIRCGEGLSVWRPSGAGFEEWRWLPDGVESARDVLRWRVEGGRLKQHGRSVDVYDDAGVARLSVSAPAAYTHDGRAIGARLRVRGRDIVLSLDAAPPDGPLLVDPAWVPSGSMAEARRYFSAVGLGDGRVLVSGGSGDLDHLTTAELWDPATRTFSSAAPMAVQRESHSSTLLPGGDHVLIAAGNFDANHGTAELYDIAADAWLDAGTLSTRRVNHAAALLPDGTVLVAGGQQLEPSVTAERYDPATNSWSPLPDVPCDGVGRPAVILPDERVWVNCGGETTQPLFDPATLSWSLTSPMKQARSNSAEAALLSSGRLLVVGSYRRVNGVNQALRTAEIYDPVTDTWVDAAPMALRRHLFAIGELDDGRLIAVGGRQDNFEYTSETEIYDEATDEWSPGPPMSSKRFGHALVEVAEGELLVAGGDSGMLLASSQLLRPGGPLGAPCDDGVDCATGFCADGVCCNEICDGQCDVCSKAAGSPFEGSCRGISDLPCDDGDACTQSDACVLGECRGDEPVVCTALEPWCHDVGTCDPETGLCSNPNKPDGTDCDDADPCTLTGSCEAGICVGHDPVVCQAYDDCHDAGVCDPATGSCTRPARTDGTACDDADACTREDVCIAGACIGGDALACPSPDACHSPGTCDAASGECTYAPRPDGASCDDGDACTQEDACNAGACLGGPPVSCAGGDACHLAGACDPATGECSFAPAPDGAPCAGGACEAGVCEPAPPANGGPSQPLRLGGGACTLRDPPSAPEPQHRRGWWLLLIAAATATRRRRP